MPGHDLEGALLRIDDDWLAVLTLADQELQKVRRNLSSTVRYRTISCGERFRPSSAPQEDAVSSRVWNPVAS